MKTILVVDKVNRQIQTRYQAEAPAQSTYGGPWGDPNTTVHLELPEGVDVDCVVISEAMEVNEDSGLKAAKQAAQSLRAAEAALDAAIAKGNAMLKKFTLENMALGITVDEMTGTVRKAMAQVISALQTGSLYDAIDELRLIPATKYDAKYITDARVLAAINELEAFLGQPLSQSIDL